MRHDDLIGALRQAIEVIEVYDEIMSLPDCNTCAANLKNRCEIAPRAGQMVRINCYYYEKEGDLVNEDSRR